MAKPTLRVYNCLGCTLLIFHGVVAAAFTPSSWSYAHGIAVGLAYLLIVWFLGGVYLSLILHLGVAHRAVIFKPWFSQSVALLQNTFGVYVNATEWVMRHRRHHAGPDRAGDPLKLPHDGFWKTVWLAASPRLCDSARPRDSILSARVFRLISNKYYAMFSQFSSFALLWLLVGEWRYALALWLSLRLLSLWIYMIVNYWSHVRKFGPRRYDDDNDAVNLSGWLAVTATFSACLHNNHHHTPQFLRLSHHPNEYDFGLWVLRGLRRLGVVRGSNTGRRVPAGVLVGVVGL
jgi:fatty-acid desaturase